MRWLSALIVGLFLLVPSFATAQDKMEEMTFQELIQTAQDAYMAEDYDRAVQYLIAANLKEPNARLLLNVAKSYEKKGDCVRSLVYYRAFVRAPEAEQSLVRAAKDVISNATDCDGWDELMAGRLLITSAPSGATVSIDGTEVGVTPVEVAGFVEGPHTIFLELDGYEAMERQVDLRPDTDEKFEFELSEKTEEAPPVAVDDTADEPLVVEQSSGGMSPTMHYAIAGGIAAVGVGLLVPAIIIERGLPSKFDDPRRDPGISQSEYNELTSNRKSAVRTSAILYTTGGILLGAGIGYGVYAFLASQEEVEPVVRIDVGGVPVSVAPAIGFGAAGLSFSGEF